LRFVGKLVDRLRNGQPSPVPMARRDFKEWLDGVKVVATDD